MGREYQWDMNLPRDRHLRPGGSKRILTIDGGGIRGLLSCGILKHVEDRLRARIEDPRKREAFVLADYYDLIAGTSTGSIVAAWLAMGKRVADLQELYVEMGPAIFGKPRQFGRIFVNRFDAEQLKAQLSEKLGDLELGSEKLVTGFGVTAKRMDTGSAWLIANNPMAPYWTDVSGSLPNSAYRVQDIVRASAAAPAYFDHVEVDIEREEGEFGAFMDGAVAGLNNPSMAFWLYTTLPGYGLSWKSGENEILVTSIGTGEYRQRMSGKALGRMSAVQRAVMSLAGSIQDVAKKDLLLMQSIGKTLTPYAINSEVDFDVAPEVRARGIGHSHCVTDKPLFSFQRYDARLEDSWFRECGLNDRERLYTERIVRNLQSMDCANSENLRRLREIGERTGELSVKPEHFPDEFNTPDMGGQAAAPPPPVRHRRGMILSPDRWGRRK